MVYRLDLVDAIHKCMPHAKPGEKDRMLRSMATQPYSEFEPVNVNDLLGMEPPALLLFVKQKVQSLHPKQRSPDMERFIREHLQWTGVVRTKTYSIDQQL
jgi:hypothetical protein